MASTEEPTPAAPDAEIEQRLADLSDRVERMALAPEEVEAPWTVRLARPFYRLLGWQPELSIACVNELLTELRRVQSGELDECEDELARALDELEANIQLAERACVVNGRIAVSQVAWLSRVTRVLAQADHALRDPQGEELAMLAAGFDPVMVAPPLRVASITEGEEIEAEVIRESADDAQSRIVELELAAIDHIIEAARSEQAFLDRRRRLLEAARRLLLDADANLHLDQEGARVRKRYLAEQIVQVDRLQGRRLSPRASLLHQARAALARNERGRLYAALVAMEGFAAAAGDLRGASLAQRAIERMSFGDDDEGRAASLKRSAAEVMGDSVIAQVQSSYAEARAAVEARTSPMAKKNEELYQLALDYLAPGAEEATASALLSVDGCFDVGAPLAPVRIEERHLVARVVTHPTQELLLTRARGPEDVQSAVIADPRAVLMDLAAGRLLARKFVRYEERRTERIEMMGEVRVYLLDGSTSMMEAPARARMRDAILTAELATLMRRFERPERYTRVLMFYRYFTKRIWPLRRVANAEDALASIGDVLSRQWDGGTDIERALITCFDMVRDARDEDGDLGRGQVVLITDGQATVRERTIRQARERVGEIPVAVSVIALGEQNDALRQLVARQRARGERAFYHFIDDETLAELSEGPLRSARALHLLDEDEPPMSRDELEDAVGDVLEEAAELERSRHRLALDPPADLEAALASLGLSAAHMSEGQRALHEAAERDRRALLARYRRWFPDPASDEDERDEAPSSISAEREDAVVVVLATVVEVVRELSGDDLARKADAIDVLERLLPDARLSPGQYDACVREPTARIRAALTAVHVVT